MMKRFFLLVLVAVFCFSSVVWAETKVWLVGDGARLELLLKNLPEGFNPPKDFFSTEKTPVTQGSKKGVRAYNRAPKKAGGSFVFVEMSDRLMKEEGSRGEICEGQKLAWFGFLRQFYNPPPAPIAIASGYSAPLCPCEITGEDKITSSALRLKSNYEGKTVILSHPRQKRILIFWVEDVEGRKVNLPNATITMVDVNGANESEVNYPTLRFDPTSCTTWYIKWWDRVGGADRGRVHKGKEVTLNSGLISISVKDEESGFNSAVIKIPWRVIVAENSQLPKETALFPKDAVAGLSASGNSFLLKDGVGTGDRLVEVSSFDGQRIWRTVAQDGVFELRPRPQGQHLIQVFHFPVDDQKGRLKPQVEAEGIYTF